MPTLTEDAVTKLLFRFYELLDQRAYLADFYEILDETFSITYEEKVWKGWRGFEDHQEGKRSMFDEIHELTSTEITLNGEKASANTRIHWEGSVWRPPEPHSHRLKGKVWHSWTFRSHPKTGKPVIRSQIVDKLELTEGELPKYLH